MPLLFAHSVGHTLIFCDNLMELRNFLLCGHCLQSPAMAYLQGFPRIA
jgi:hypothetical protein